MLANGYFASGSCIFSTVKQSRTLINDMVERMEKPLGQLGKPLELTSLSSLRIVHIDSYRIIYKQI